MRLPKIPPLMAFAIAASVLLIIGSILKMTGHGQAAMQAAVITAFCAMLVGGYIFTVQVMNSSELNRRFDKMQGTNARKREETPQEIARRQLNELYSNRSTWVESTSRLIRRLFRIEGERLAKLRLELQAAGYHRERALALYLVAMAMGPPVGMALGLMWGNMRGATGVMVPVWVGGGGLLGFLLVRQFISRKTTSRNKSIAVTLPEVIDLLVIYAQAGMGTDSALRRISQAMHRRYPVVSEEILMLWQELQVLPERVRAYENFQARCVLPLVKNFCSIMMQSEQMGSPITESLGLLAKETRRERLFEAKRKAAKLPTIMQLPIVLFILPSIFMTVLGSTAITIMKAFNVMQ